MPQIEEQEETQVVGDVLEDPGSLTVIDKPKRGRPKGKKNGTKKHKVDPTPKAEPYVDPDKEGARKAGLRLGQYKVLRYIAKRPEGSEGATYDDIKGATGYYQSLTADLRAGKEGSTTEKGYTKEVTIEVAGKTKVAFTATAKGRKLFSK